MYPVNTGYLINYIHVHYMVYPVNCNKHNLIRSWNFLVRFLYWYSKTDQSEHSVQYMQGSDWTITFCTKKCNHYGGLFYQYLASCYNNNQDLEIARVPLNKAATSAVIRLHHVRGGLSWMGQLSMILLSRCIWNLV